MPPHREDWAVHRDGDQLYGDTSFLNAAGQLPGFTVKHMGFGEFTLQTPKGEVEFDRMRGKDFPGRPGARRSQSAPGGTQETESPDQARRRE